MKIFLTALLALAAAVPAAAAKGTTVQQLMDVVSSSETSGRPDKEIARKIADVELTERLTRNTLNVLLHQASGPLTKNALQTLANTSSFLDPPASESLAGPAPSQAEQEVSIEKTRSYVENYVRKLPNFSSTVVVRRFDDNGARHLRLNDTVVGQLTFNGGKEVASVRAINGVQLSGKVIPGGLKTHDEIGGLLSNLFFGDVSPKFVWSHWEEMQGRRVAVFHYSLDRAHSHFTVSYCCRPGVVDVPTTLPTAAKGTLAIATDSGAVFRVTEQALEIQTGLPIRNAAIAVEYGPVPIGNKSIICPIRSISISDLQVPDAMALDGAGIIRSLNETQFTDYHEFGARSTIITSDAAQTATPIQSSTASHEPSAVRAPDEDEEEASREVLPPPTAVKPPSETSQPPAEASMPAQTAKASAPAVPAAPAAEDGDLVTATSFKVRVSVVTVRAVVRDKQGHFVDDLKKEDFDLFDGSKPQVITGFSVERASDEKAQQTKESPQESARSTSSAATASVSSLSAPNRYVDYLFDDLNLKPDDLPKVRNAALRALADSSEPATRIAINTTSGRVVVDFTNDQAKLVRALKSIQPNMGEPHMVCPPSMSYYLADQILNEVNLRALQLGTLMLAGCGSKSPELEAKILARITIAQHEPQVLTALGVVEATARRMAALPGQRIVVLVSPGFVTTSKLAEINRVVDRASRNGVIINALDARGLYTSLTTEIEAANDAAAVDPQVVILQNQIARDEQNTVSSVLTQLANGTGGTFFQNNNDFYSGFK